MEDKKEDNLNTGISISRVNIPDDSNQDNIEVNESKGIKSYKLPPEPLFDNPSPDAYPDQEIQPHSQAEVEAIADPTQMSAQGSNDRIFIRALKQTSEIFEKVYQCMAVLDINSKANVLKLQEADVLHQSLYTSNILLRRYNPPGKDFNIAETLDEIKSFQLRIGSCEKGFEKYKRFKLNLVRSTLELLVVFLSKLLEAKARANANTDNSNNEVEVNTPGVPASSIIFPSSPKT